MPYARKDHTCENPACGKKIRKGRYYTSKTFKDSKGQYQTSKFCTRCFGGKNK